MVCMSSKRIIFHSTILFLTLEVLSLCLADVADDNLKRLTNKCYNFDSCQGEYRGADNLEETNCHCLKNCSTFGTCCMDSEHRTRNGLGTVPFKCMRPYGIQNVVESTPLFMVDGCKNDDTNAQRLCLADGEALNDPFLLVPVTSIKTGFTYRNYFCFACNEDSESFSPVSWDLALHNDVSNDLKVPLSNLRFNKELKTWAVGNMSVLLSMRIPNGLERYYVKCVESVIQTCAEDWPNPDTRKECEAYMALVRFKGQNGEKKTYRNPHCATCNYEDLSRTRCLPSTDDRGGGLRLFIGLFTLDDKEHRCPKKQHYDKFSKKCRGFRCGKNQLEWRGFCSDKQ